MGAIIKFLMRTIPRPWLIRFSFAFSYIMSFFLKGNTYACPVCGGHFRKLLPYGLAKRPNALCPKCLSLERHRLIWLYLQKETPFFKDNLSMLHIAPEQCFYKRLKKQPNLTYTTGDLESPIADIHFDIQAIPLADNTYDVVMSNHVMEHIPDDAKAMSEIYRILKPNGFAVLQVPLDENADTTYEDLSITDPLEREKHFGQKDHLRQYGKDYQTKLEKAGFKVTKIYYAHTLGATLQAKYCLDKNEAIYFSEKK